MNSHVFGLRKCTGIIVFKERSVGGITRSESETFSSLDSKLVRGNEILGRVLLLLLRSTGKEGLLNMSHSSLNTGQDVQCFYWASRTPNV